MNVLVDTSVWSLALRRRDPVLNPHVVELRELIRELRATIIGPIRQELLSGIRDRRYFETLRERLSGFPDFELSTADFERAAEFFNHCRAHGVQGSNTDFLLCAVAERRGIPIFTTDRDFKQFQRHLAIQLHAPRGESEAN